MAFVVSSGQLQTLSRPVRPIAAPVRLASNVVRDYGALWTSQPELRTVVDFLARNIAQLGLHVFRRVSDVDRQRLTDHPLAALLGRPNPTTTRYRLIDALIHDLCIFDQALWLKGKAENGRPVALRRVPPSMVTPVGDDWLEADGYEIRGSRGKTTVPAEAVVVFRGYNPDDPRVGSSPIESLRQVLAEEYAAAQYRAQLWSNGARMAGYISRPPGVEWRDGARERFRDQWRAAYSGDGPDAGGTPILEDGMKFEAAATSPADAQYVESRKLTREEVARAYHVPLPMVGILDHATFSNIKEQHKQLYQDCLGPWLEMIQQELELQLLPDLPDTDSVYVEFNFQAKLQGAFEDQAAQLQGATGAPYMTRNEARARLNYPQVPGGDDLVVPLNVLLSGGGTADAPPDIDDSGQPKTRLPFGATLASDGMVRLTPGEYERLATGKARPWPTPTATPPVEVKARAEETVVDQAAAILARFFKRQGQAVVSKLGAEKARGSKAGVDDVFDSDRWDRELGVDLLRINTLVAGAAALGTFEALGMDLEEVGFNEAIMAGWLAENALGVARVTNVTTAGALRTVLGDDDPPAAARKLFDAYESQRAQQIATTQTSSISGFGSVEAAKHAGGDEVMKVWRTGKNPRPSHKRLDGESVPVDGRFSNGARWPADSSALDVDEIAGCNCELVIRVP